MSQLLGWDGGIQSLTMNTTELNFYNGWNVQDIECAKIFITLEQ